MTTLLQDLQYGLRTLRKTPGFTVVAVLTLALGIGANVALFSVVNGVLLNPLPFPQADQLIALHESKPNFEQGSISYPNFRDWQKDNHTFSALAVSRGYAFSLTGMGEAEQVNAEFVSSDFFPILGVSPVLGRNFASGENEVGAAPVALISTGFWQRKFGSAPDILNKVLTLDGRNYTVIGVVPATFHLPIASFQERDLYAPIGQWNNPLLQNRGAGLGIHGIARLKSGVTIEQARADMKSVTGNLANAFPDFDRGIGASLVPLKKQIVGDVQPVLLVLLAAVGFVLLIACVNVANLLLARSTGRTREFAIRAALGASRPRVLRQLLTESILLAAVGGGLGLLLAAWGTRAALGLVPTTLPRADEIGLDPRVLFFTVAITLLAGVLFGLAPALKMSQPNLHETLGEGARGSSGSHHRIQGIFVVVEMALALVLLIGAGLMVRSLARLWSVDPGFNPHQVLSFNISPPPSLISATPDAIRAAMRDLHNRLQRTTGVKSASITLGALPLSSDDEQLFWFDGQPKPASQNDMSWAIDYIVDADYLKVMQTPLQRGRFFTDADNEHAPRVVVVDEVFANKYFPHQDALGKRIHISNSDTPSEIVGIVGHVKQWGLDADDTESLRAQFYIPCLQMPDEFIKLTASGMSAVVRSDGTDGLFNSIRRSSEEMSSQQVIYGAQSMDEIIASSLASRRFSMTLLGVFAGLALLLASVGIYGVISYVVGQRVHEIGIRMALGARHEDILRMILGSGSKLALTGVGVGLLAALGITRLMASMLYGVGAKDPLTFAGVAILLTLVALAACYVPARRATRVDPMVALRYE